MLNFRLNEDKFRCESVNWIRVLWISAKVCKDKYSIIENYNKYRWNTKNVIKNQTSHNKVPILVRKTLLKLFFTVIDNSTGFCSGSCLYRNIWTIKSHFTSKQVAWVFKSFTNLGINDIISSYMLIAVQ